MARSYPGFVFTFAKFVQLHELLQGLGLLVELCQGPSFADGNGSKQDACAANHVASLWFFFLSTLPVSLMGRLVMGAYEYGLDFDLVQELPACDNRCACPSISWPVQQCEVQSVNQ